VTHTCDACLRRSWLLRELSGHLEPVRAEIGELLTLGDEELIAAVRPMMIDRPHLHVVMAGEGGELDRLKAMIDGFGLSGRIHLLGFRSDIDNV